MDCDQQLGAPILQPGVIKLLQKKKHQPNLKEWKANMGKHNDIFVLFINYRKVTASTLFHISGIAVLFRLIANNNFSPIQTISPVPFRHLSTSWLKSVGVDCTFFFVFNFLFIQPVN